MSLQFIILVFWINIRINEFLGKNGKFYLYFCFNLHEKQNFLLTWESSTSFTNFPSIFRLHNSHIFLLKILYTNKYTQRSVIFLLLNFVLAFLECLLLFSVQNYFLKGTSKVWKYIFFSFEFNWWHFSSN